MKGVTIAPLSQPETQRNWNGGEDTVYPRKDGKTPAPLLQLDIGFWDMMCRIGGRLGSMLARVCGVTLEIPPFMFQCSNHGPLPGFGTVSGG